MQIIIFDLIFSAIFTDFFQILGLQEFIEAMSFYHFIKFGTILLWSQV